MDGRLPDTPWHVGYAKKAENDPRRHKARCVHNVDGICNSSGSHYYLEKCGGSSHCIDYSETYEEYKKKLDERKTAEQIAQDNIEKYKSSLAKDKQALAKSDNIMCHKSTEDLRRCLVCDEGLRKIKFSLKKCSYCGMFYVNLQDSTNPAVLEIVKAQDIFLMNVPRKKSKEQEGQKRKKHQISIKINMNNSRRK